MRDKLIAVRSAVVVLGILFGALGAGCTIGADDATAPDGTVPASAMSPVPGSGAWFAKGFAAAMGDSVVAATVRDILRDSPYAYHRVHLQGILRGTQGRIVLDAVARALGTTGSEVLRAVDASPRLSLTVPSGTRRVTWTGSPSVLVAAQFRDEPAPRVAYGSRGTVVTLAEAKKHRADTTTPPFFAIKPFEVLAQRHTVLPAIGRRTIGLKGESQRATASVTLDAKGERVVEEQLAPIEGGWRVTSRKSLRGGGGATLDITTSPDTLWVGRFKTNQLEDMDEDEGSVHEFIFQFEYKSRATGQQVVAKYTDYNGVYTQDVNINLPVLYRKPDAFGRVYGALVEDDGWWGTDHYGEYFFEDETHNFHDDPTSFDTYLGYWETGIGYTISLNFKWHPSSYSINNPGSASSGEYAVISGSSSTQANSWCTYIAGTSLSGATIEWFLNGDFAGTGSQLVFTAPSQEFSLVVGAYDSNGQWAWDQKTVTIDGYSTCQPERKAKRLPP